LIYLDHNATTPLAPEALEAMLPFLREHYGNPSSAHALGRMPEAALVQARAQVAELINCQPAEVVFNSGGTEGINHAFKGVFAALPTKRHFVSTAVEHTAVQAMLGWLQRQGAEVSILDVDGSGRLNLDQLKASIRTDTALVSVMAANNETGVVFPLEEVGAIVKERGVLFHVDAVQMAGKAPLRPREWGADLLNISAHKFQGPKGAGALFIRRGLRLQPLIAGGQQERERRGGTENVPALVGMGAAAARMDLGAQASLAALRDRLEAAMLGAVPDVRIHGREAVRLSNSSLLSFRGIEGEALLLKLSDRGICVSTGSACTTGQKEPSHVLRALGVPLAFARGTLRISLGHDTRIEEIEEVMIALPALVQELRGLKAMGR
jgi:cysteine desulfurase